MFYSENSDLFLLNSFPPLSVICSSKLRTKKPRPNYQFKVKLRHWNATHTWEQCVIQLASPTTTACQWNYHELLKNAPSETNTPYIYKKKKRWAYKWLVLASCSNFLQNNAPFGGGFQCDFRENRLLIYWCRVHQQAWATWPTNLRISERSSSAKWCYELWFQ